MIFSYELETQLLAGLIKYPGEYCKIAAVISDKDFYSESNKINKTIFLILKQALENAETINEVIISQRVKDLGISFEENINPSDYIESLAVKKIGADSVLATAKELKKFTIRRQIYERCVSVGKKMRGLSSAVPYQEIIDIVDKDFNDQINLYESNENEPENIFDTMEEVVEERGTNPITDFGLKGPHPILHSLYGSLVRGGNISVVVARSAVGKELANYAKIKTPTGWTTHGEVKVGDKVSCPDGSISTVNGVFPQGKKDIYRFHFSKGHYVDAGLEHLWKVCAEFNNYEFSYKILTTKEVYDLIDKSEVFIPVIAHSSKFDKYVVNENIDSFEQNTSLNRLLSIKKLDKQEECTCISIDHPDHLYITDNYIVTHNTQFAMDFCTKIAYEHNVPVLHFDNGEMSKSELLNRQCAAMSGVSLSLIEKGTWRKAGKEIVDKVRSVWPRIKNLKFYYFNVGGTNIDAQINILKRFYYSKIGRGNKLIFSFDYIKALSDGSFNNKQEHQVIGEMIDKYKRCIQKDLVFNNEPVVSMFTSVQANRSGIVGNKHSDELIEDEGVASLSDRIQHFCSHMFLLRNKTLDEIISYPNFGTHVLKNLKSRHLGDDVAGALNPVKMPDGSFKKNYLNFEFSNFGITEKGDLRDIVKSMEDHILAENEPDDIPKGL
jgi:replicative DNA helicase